MSEPIGAKRGRGREGVDKRERESKEYRGCLKRERMKGEKRGEGVRDQIRSVQRFFLQLLAMMPRIPRFFVFLCHVPVR